jgi:SSS family solute:Na+ symporter
MGYNLVTQLFPSVVLAIPAIPWATRAGAFAGILVGEATVAYMTIGHVTLGKLLPTVSPLITDLNIGIVAMLLNILTVVSVSFATRKSHPQLARS